MANTDFAYVRNFEPIAHLAPSNWIIIRLDGRGFSKLTQKYAFDKPNDARALDLMNAAAAAVVEAMPDVVLAYGQSDEYSFVLHESCTMFDRRTEKLATTFASAFTAEYCLLWPQYFQEQELSRPFPSFDARCVCYPKRKILRDYLSWRQADCHINNLYNTTFWHLVLKGGMNGTEAEESLKGTVSGHKNEILFSEFGVNYNNEPAMFRKGTVIYRAYDDGGDGSSGVEGEGAQAKQKMADPTSKTQIEKEKKRRKKARIAVEHVDIIGDGFWEARPYILASKRGQDYGE